MNNILTLLTILVAFMGAYLLRFGHLQPEPAYLIAILTGLLLASIIIPATGAFRPEFRWAFLRKLRRLMAGWALVVVGMVGLAAMLKVTAVYSRVWFGYWVIFGALGLVAVQLAMQLWIASRRTSPGQQRHVVLVGKGRHAAQVEQRIRNDSMGQMRLVASFGHPWSDQDTRPVAELADYIASHAVHEVWIAAPIDDRRLLEDTLDALKESVVDVNVVPDLQQYRLLNQGITEWEGLPVVNLSGTPMSRSERRLKTILDRLTAFVLVIVLAPLLLLIALLVRLSGPGPVLFRQVRHGIGGEPIEVFKFRTMKPHRERPGRVTQATEDDARVTRVGRFLRRTSLDELPQLFNVLKGEMSMVGPRPQAVEHNQEFKSRIPRYMLRHKVKPGITGWAQVNGLRGITDTPEKMTLRIEHDLWYIQNWSMWLDLKILLLTPLAMIHRNAF